MFPIRCSFGGRLSCAASSGHPTYTTAVSGMACKSLGKIPPHATRSHELHDSAPAEKDIRKFVQLWYRQVFNYTGSREPKNQVPRLHCMNLGSKVRTKSYYRLHTWPTELPSPDWLCVSVARSALGDGMQYATGNIDYREGLRNRFLGDGEG